MAISVKEKEDSAEAWSVFPERLGEGFKGKAGGNSPFIQGGGYTDWSRDPKWEGAWHENLSTQDICVGNKDKGTKIG